MRRLYNNLIDKILFPPVCVLCGDSNQEFNPCSGCQTDLPWTKSVCHCCGLPLSSSFISSITPCGRCQRSPPPYDQMFAPFSYEPPLDRLIIGLKFQGRLAYARLLGELLANYLASRKDSWPELILPVPLHQTRLRMRGYNQALELARPVARRLRLPIAFELCQRVRATAAQSGLNATTREKNVHGAFAVKTGEIAERRVAILDDVVTTGYTVNELARVLRQAGAQWIEVWAVARTLA
ncbi:competence protein ComFC [Gammaproteobacteria bacterium]